MYRVSHVYMDPDERGRLEEVVKQMRSDKQASTGTLRVRTTLLRF